MAGWRSRWLESISPIREQWRRERLRFAGLTGPERTLATLALVVIAVASLAVVLFSLGVDLPGRVIQVPGRLLAADAPIAVPAALVVGGCIGMGIGAAAIVAGATGRGRGAGRLFAVIALAEAGLGGLLLSNAGAVRFHEGIALPERPWVLPLYDVTAYLAFIGAAAVASAPLTRLRFMRAAPPLLAAAPFLSLAATVVVAGDATATLPPWVQAQSLDYPATLDLNATVVPPVLFVVASAAGLLALLSIWQASEFSKAAARHVGTALAVSANRWTGVLAALLVAKVAWLVAGLLGVLPPALGGASRLWEEIESDDAFAWAYAAALAVGGMAWLLGDRRGISEERARSAAGRTVLIFALAAFVVTALPLVVAATAGAGTSPRPEVPGDVLIGECVGTWAPYGASALLSCLALALTPWQGVWWFAVVAGSLVAGLWILRRAPNHGGGIFLAALGLWAMPRAIDVLGVFHPRELSMLDGIPAIDAPQPATFDVAVTIVVCVLAAGLWTGRQRRIHAGSLIVILAVSTLLIDASAVAPSAPGAVLVALALIFPVLYELAFDSGDVNRPRADRPGALLQAVGVRALALTTLAMLLVIDVARLQESSQAQLGFTVFAIPLAGTIVASTIRRRDDHDADASFEALSGTARPSAGALGLGALAGVVAVTALAGVGWLFERDLAGLYPTPAQRVEQLRARFDALEETINTTSLTDPATPTALHDRWTEERTWIGDHPAPDCALDAWQSWASLVSDIRNAGIVIDAYTHAPPAPPQSEIDAVNGVLTRVDSSMASDRADVRRYLEQAAADC